MNMKKLKTVALALGLGLGLNAMFVGTSTAGISYDQCMNLKAQCEAGNSNACGAYNHWCLVCELFPSSC